MTDTITLSRSVGWRLQALADRVAKLGNGEIDGNSLGNALGKEMRILLDAALAQAEPAQDPIPRNTKTHDHLSTMIGLVQGAHERGQMPYKPGSAVDKAVKEAVEHLKDWPYPSEAAQPAQQADWNRRIRDSVDSLLDQAGYQPDSSARHFLGMMNFDAQPAQQPDHESEIKELRIKLRQQSDLVDKCMAAMNANADKGEAAEAELARLKAQDNEADELLRNLGLDPDTYRTDGGYINHLKVKAAILHPDEYPVAQPAQEPLLEKMLKSSEELTSKVFDGFSELMKKGSSISQYEASVNSVRLLFSELVRCFHVISERAKTAQPAQQPVIDAATLAGLHSTIGHLSELVDQQRSVLAEVEDVCGRDGHGAVLEDGESEVIDKVRAMLSVTQEPPIQQPMSSSAERQLHDFPALQAFHTKHALGPMLPPSCLCCGQQTHPVTRPVSIKHMELPGIVICKQCHDAAVAQPAQELSPTAGMNIAQRILHVGGRNNAIGYVEFGSIQAVEALVHQVLRDMPKPPEMPIEDKIEKILKEDEAALQDAESRGRAALEKAREKLGFKKLEAQEPYKNKWPEFSRTAMKDGKVAEATVYVDGVPSYLILDERKPVAQPAQDPPQWVGLSQDDLIDAMTEPGCERIDSFYVVGPVQKAAVISFADAIEKLLRKKNGAQPAQQEPIYQYQSGDGSWIDQAKPSYDYNVQHGHAKVRIVYTAPLAQPAQQERKPLTPEQREEIAKGWRGRNWTVGDIIDATEAAHGITGSKT